MNLPLLFALALAQTSAQAPAPTASALISKMFARYAGAKTFTGTIKAIQSARGVSVVTNTVVAYERPAKIHVEQQQNGRQTHRASTLVSDGTSWVWSKPESLFGQARYLKESVAAEGRPPFTIANFYGVAGADMPDRSLVLDLIVARTEDLQHFKDGLISFSYSGKGAIDGRAVHRIVGTAHDNQILGASESYSTLRRTEDFELDLSDEGDIVRYVLTQTFAVPASAGRPATGDSVVVTTTWDVAGKVDAAIPPSAFKLPQS